MDAAGLTVVGVAEQARTDTSIIEAIISGEHPVRLDETYLLAAALGVTPGRLLLGSPEEGRDDA